MHTQVASRVNAMPTPRHLSQASSVPTTHSLTGGKVTMPPRKNGTTTVLDGDPWMYIEDVSELLEIPIATLRYHRVNGRGPNWCKVGRRLRIRRSAALTWFRETYETDQ